MWMSPEGVMLRGVCQTEEDAYGMFSQYMWDLKKKKNTPKQMNRYNQADSQIQTTK